MEPSDSVDLMLRPSNARILRIEISNPGLPASLTDLITSRKANSFACELLYRRQLFQEEHDQAVRTFLGVPKEDPSTFVKYYSKYIALKGKRCRVKGSVRGMPKLQLLRDFFCELEGPYTVVKLTAEAAKERVGRLELLSCGDRFGYFSALVEYFVASAKVVECRQYQNDVELVRYAVRVYSAQSREWSDRHQLIVKYNGVGELLAYSFDPAERYPMEIKADICEGDPDNPRKMHYPEQTVRWEDVLDFAWGEKDGGGVFVFEDGGNGSYISCWEVGEEDQECFSIEWCPYLIGRLRMVATTKSRGEMVDFLRKYMRGGLAEAQQCFTWRLSCNRLGAIEFVDEVTADLMRAKRKGQKEILESSPLLEIVRIDSCSMYYDNKNEKEIVRLVKKALKNGGLPDSENPMSLRLLVIFYLAVRGDRDSCKKLASLFWKRKNKQLCNYWRKCAGLAELKPRTPRTRKREPSNQLQFGFGII